MKYSYTQEWLGCIPSIKQGTVLARKWHDYKKIKGLLIDADWKVWLIVVHTFEF